ncbi:MAG: hypothetical protein M4579_003345 [Chaenotheca gracillima]|nr:MAG: hypothetical protein M4579_003345 [Chaenotheca gracillima]
MNEEKPETMHVERGQGDTMDRSSGSETAYEESHAGPARELSPEHREYLMKRHGTVNLNPLPSSDPADPYNWPAWKKNVNLALVAFHAFMTTFIAAGVIPAFENFSEDLHVELQTASYLTSIQILILGLSPLFWKPISNHYGRRPVWLISTAGAMICNIGCAETKSYGAMVVTRILVSFFISPAMALGSATVSETFFEHERGQKLGAWALTFTLGPPTGPFIMGFVAYHLGWEWIYWIFAIINGVQFVAYFFFGPETLWNRNVVHKGSTFKKEFMTFGRVEEAPLRLWSFIQPLHLITYLSIVIPTISYSIIFNFAGVLLTVEIPQLFGPKFAFNPQQIGLQFIGMIIGSVIGEQIGGPLGDVLMNRRAKKLGRRPAPEYRLWSSYLGFLTVIVGLLVCFIQLQRAPPLHWNVTPIVGIAISAFGNQIITTVCVTYAVDCHPEQAASIGVFVNVIRSTWAFIGPFWFPDMFTSLGLIGSAGLMSGLIVVFSVFPIMALQFKGEALRNRHG